MLSFLSGNIRVYCRVRPFLSGQDEKSTIDYMGENGEMLISNKLKQGKDGHRMFKFNKVFSPSATQGMFLSQI
jgi:kinesin family protein C2/C3